VERLRTWATAAGAQFIDLPKPAVLEASADRVRVHVDGMTIEPPVILIAAGAGTVQSLSELGLPCNAQLRQTPLLVYSGDRAALMPPIFVDYERGFSSVRHHTRNVASGTALVVGTKVREEPVPFQLPDSRVIKAPQIDAFKACLSAPFLSLVPEARFTAGFELMPLNGSSFLEPWIEDLGLVVIASPGRATLGLNAAQDVLGLLISKLDDRTKGTVGPFNCGLWVDPIHMHFSDHYKFTDAEEA